MPNKDIQMVLLYWAELQLTLLAHELRLNSLVFLVQLLQHRKEAQTKASISPNIKSSHSQPSQ